MMVLLANWRGAEFNEIIRTRTDIGNLMSPLGWKMPLPGIQYALDNDAYTVWSRSQNIELTEEERERWRHYWDDGGEGSGRWLGMLDKIPLHTAPMFVLLPDVVTQWEPTIARAEVYMSVLRKRCLSVAIALQDGSEDDTRRVMRLDPDWVFIGGSTAWKWKHIEPITKTYQNLGVKVHVGRTSGPRRIRECLRVGVDSCDGTGWGRNPGEMLPTLWRELDMTHVQRLMDI